MNEVVIAWAMLAIIFPLRYLQSFRIMQRAMHSCGQLVAKLVQWYSVSAIFFSLALIRNVYDIVKYDYHGLDFLDRDRIAEKFDLIAKDKQAEFTEEDAKELLLRPWLKVVAQFAPVAGVFSFLLVFFQVRLLIRQSQKVRANQSEGDKYPWWMRKLMDPIVLVIANPVLFVVLSMKAMIRVLTVMTGSAWSRAAKLAGKTWEDVVAGELSMFVADLEIAYAVQFVTVWSFASMCGSLMSEAKFVRDLPSKEQKQYKRTLFCAAIQGIYAYVAIGLIRCALDFGVAIMLSWNDPTLTEKALVIQDKYLGKISTIFSFVTILCILNMGCIGNVQAITAHLGNATAKFLALRLLLLVSQTQLNILLGLTTGSTLYSSIMQHQEQIQPLFDKYLPHAHLHLEDWTFSKYQAYLLHASLLSYECLLMVILNLIFWKLSTKQAEEITLWPEEPKESNKSGLQEPLLGQ